MNHDSLVLARMTDWLGAYTRKHGDAFVTDEVHRALVEAYAHGFGEGFDHAINRVEHALRDDRHTTPAEKG